MKIKLSTNLGGAHHRGTAGEFVEVPDDEGQALIDANLATNPDLPPVPAVAATVEADEDAVESDDDEVVAVEPASQTVAAIEATRPLSRRAEKRRR